MGQMTSILAGDLLLYFLKKYSSALELLRGSFFSCTLVRTFIDHLRHTKRRFSMQSPKPSSPTGAIISLVGAACALLGFFLPLLAGPASEAGYSEWQLLIERWQLFLLSANRGIFTALVFGLLALLLTLPLLSALVVLGTSASAWFKSNSLGFLTLWRLAAITGLFIQSVTAIIVLGNTQVGETIGLGLVLLLLGFLLTVVGAFPSKAPLPTPEQKPVNRKSTRLNSSHVR